LYSEDDLVQISALRTFTVGILKIAYKPLCYNE